MRSLIVFIVLFSISKSYAQEKLTPVSTPTSPAAYVLGMEPSAVLKPKSYRAMETALYSNFLNNGKGVIPNDFAAEFTPYWTKNHSLSLEDYLYPKGVGKQLERTSSFSLASTQNFLLEDSTATSSIALGWRARFYLGGDADRTEITTHRANLKAVQGIVREIVTESEAAVLRTAITNRTEFLNAIRPTVVRSIYEGQGSNSMLNAEALTKTIYDAAATLPQLDKDNPEVFLDAFYELLAEKTQLLSVFEQFKSYIKNRQGFHVDVAYAGLLNFPTNNFEFSVAPRQSLWITPTFSISKSGSLSVMAVGRYEWYHREYYKKYFPAAKIYTNNIDYGLAVSAELNKVSLQFETVGRTSNSLTAAGVDGSGNKLYTKDRSSDVQYIGSFGYRISDQIILSYKLGNGFKPVINPTQTLISLLSLNLGFGGPTEDDIN